MEKFQILWNGGVATNATQSSMNESLMPLFDMVKMHLECDTLEITIGLCGTVFNILILVGLKAKNNDLRAADFLLAVLAIWDMAFTGFSCIQGISFKLFKRVEESTSSSRQAYFIFCLLSSYFSTTTIIGTMSSTVLIAMDRVVSIYSKTLRWVTPSRSRQRSRAIVCITLIVAVTSTIPLLLIYLCIWDAYPHNNLLRKQDTVLPACKARAYAMYVVSCIISWFGINFISCLILLVLNCILISNLCRARRKLRTQRHLYASHSGNFNDRSLTAVILSIVFLEFFAYPGSGLIWVVKYTTVGFQGLLIADGENPYYPFTSMRTIFRVAQLLNSSIGILFYICFGRRFRRKLYRRLMCKTSD